eukprot:Nitzschia sp. Nitz4//scaffold31_size150131//76788//78119//NITZ4_002834-RA/size150131-processed-gene-0.112-mRNA-1//1//CDS//3329547677//5580//frame0
MLSVIASSHRVSLQRFSSKLLTTANSSTSTGGSSLLVRCRLQQQVHNFSTFSRKPVQPGGATGLQAKTVSQSSGSSRTWKRIALAFKITRIPLLLTAIYTLGYQNGVVETVRNPLKIQQGTFEEILASFGVKDGNRVSIIAEKVKDPKLSRIGWIRGGVEKQEERDARAQKVAEVGRIVINSARRFVRSELEKATEKATEKLKSREAKLSKLEYVRELNADPEVEHWQHALERIEGFTVDGDKNWQYILIDTHIPNAFVSEMLPQRFFVTTGLFKEFVSNDDELAMILGHEISHLIMGHNSTGNIVEFLFRGLEITLLMLDPTEGMLSLAVASFLGSSREAIVAAHSRSNEGEADELGCKLAAMGCFNTKRGAKVFKKMHDFEEANGGSKNDLMSSHPASSGRYEFVRNLAKDENDDKYSECDTFRKRLRRAFRIVRKDDDDE